MTPTFRWRDPFFESLGLLDDVALTRPRLRTIKVSPISSTGLFSQAFLIEFLFFRLTLLSQGQPGFQLFTVEPGTAAHAVWRSCLRPSVRIR